VAAISPCPSPLKNAGSDREIEGKPVGVELTYRAIPDDTRLFELVALSRDHGEALEFINLYFSGERHRNAEGDEINRLFSLEAQRIKMAHPGIELRSCTLDRRWDMLHYLLSEQRRTEAFQLGSGTFRPNDDDNGSRAVWGEKDIHANAIATQGFPLRYASGPCAAATARWLNALTRDDLQSRYDPEAMDAQGVYKLYQDSVYERLFEDLWECFEKLKSFYQAIAQHHEGALIVLD
jgi:hypothetical protein